MKNIKFFWYNTCFALQEFDKSQNTLGKIHFHMKAMKIELFVHVINKQNFSGVSSHVFITLLWLSI